MIRKSMLVLSFLFVPLLWSQEVDFKTIQLSYISNDRAAGILKSLGYAVIDFEVSNGPNPNEFIYKPSGNIEDAMFNGDVKNADDLPLIIVMPESDNITLLEMQGAASTEKSEMSVDLGGSSMVYTTTGEPLQRLMVVYDKDRPESISKLIGIIKNEIDVPAKQIIIEALIIEIDATEINALGSSFSRSGSMYSSSFPQPNSETGSYEPFTLTLDRSLLGNTVQTEAKLQALMTSQSATILSRPSVLVIDGRQARIVVGEQIPVSRSTATGQNVVSSTDYIPIGIVLNLRPRVANNRKEITMQIETIISEVKERVGVGSIGGNILSAPVFNSRMVQSYVKVADNTPFIIGGLISKRESDQKSKLPFISRIPLIGSIFSFSNTSESQKEVLVVITPHIIHENDNSFTRVIPKDSDLFNSLGNELFQNSYRLQVSDVFDLGFVKNTSIFKNVKKDATEYFNQNLGEDIDPGIEELANGSIPGEEILIRRMLYNVIERVGYYKYIDPNNIIFFEEGNTDSGVKVRRFEPIYTNFIKDKKNKNKGLVLTFESSDSDLVFEDFPLRPVVNLSNVNLTDKGYKSMLWDLNFKKKENYSILLTDSDNERRLYEVLVLRRVLEANPNILKNISKFKAGRNILFPSPASLENDTHALDEEIAQYFYEINDYNNTFDESFINKISALKNLLDEK
mgnify:FL=1